MANQAKSSWGRRVATLALVSTVSVAATVAVMPLKPVAAQSAGAAPLVRGLPDFTDLVDAVKACGYRYVTLDLEGFRSGNLNPPQPV